MSKERSSKFLRVATLKAVVLQVELVHLFTIFFGKAFEPQDAKGVGLCVLREGPNRAMNAWSS